ncbi:MAG: hypothetical protein CL938_05565 [Deltaproteobacteria bacterium]|jgi:hypothetical protein|nr:hypothetical protein [Deltaproteobacteria bacterium]
MRSGFHGEALPYGVQGALWGSSPEESQIIRRSVRRSGHEPMLQIILARIFCHTGIGLIQHVLGIR